MARTDPDTRKRRAQWDGLEARARALASAERDRRHHDLLVELIDLLRTGFADTIGRAP